MTKPRLILAALDWTRPKDPPMSLGLASILANVERFGFNVIHRSWAVNQPSKYQISEKNFDPQPVVEFVMANATEKSYFGLGAYVWNENCVQTILKRLRNEGFPGKVILGGPQISYSGRGLEKYYPNADIFVRGYAEQAIVHILQVCSTVFPLSNPSPPLY